MALRDLLLDHFVDGRQKGRWNREGQALCGLEATVSKPSFIASACESPCLAAVLALSGFIRSAIRVALGTRSWRSCARFGPSTSETNVIPVRWPHGSDEGDEGPASHGRSLETRQVRSDRQRTTAGCRTRKIGPGRGPLREDCER